MGGAVAVTLEKLPAIRGNLTRTDPNWEEWNFALLMETQRLWTRSKPVGKTEERSCKPQFSSSTISRLPVAWSGRWHIIVFTVRVTNTRPTTAVPRPPKNARKSWCERKCLSTALQGNKELMRARARCPVDLRHKRHHTSICQTPE